jgi:hypothetical protein
MRHRERGVTFLGWIFILVPVGMVLYGGIRLTPKYLEYMKIARTLEQVRDEYSGDGLEARALRSAIERRFDIEDVTVIKKDDIKITKQGSGYTIEASYYDTVPFVANVSLLVEFDKAVTLE